MKKSQLPLSIFLSMGLLATVAQTRETNVIEEKERLIQKLYDSIAPSVVFISSKNGFGSGFLVDKQGLVLTNAHVVGKDQQVDVVLHSGKKVLGKVVELGSQQLDAAVVQIPEKDTVPLAIALGDNLRIGAWVASIGHGAGGIWTFNEGVVSNIYPRGSQRPVFQTQIPLNPGLSGGPIFDRNGNIVGIVTAGLTQSNSINFGIKIEVAIRSLSKLSNLVPCVLIRAPGNSPIFLDGKIVGSGPEALVPIDKGQHEAMIVIDGKISRRTFSFPESKEINLAEFE